jgi:sialate O-acetylesterase
MFVATSEFLKRFAQHLLAIIGGLGLFYATVNANELLLKNTWLFKLGDEIAWANPNLSDSGWYPIRVPEYWENQNYENYDGIAWYRSYFKVDSSWLRRDTLILYLGKIDASDEVFLNGVRIGGSGHFPPTPVSAKNLVRRYTFPASLLKTNNVLAVRVYDDQQFGGIYSGPL